MSELQRLTKLREEREAMRKEATVIARQIMTVFSENNVTIRQAKLALEQSEKMLSEVTIQEIRFIPEEN